MPPKQQFDVAVIGGGPAGMVAAGRAAQLGAKVIVIEKNASLGKKLLITGGGRCNVTNATLDRQLLLDRFKGSKKFLHSPFTQYGVEDALQFFHERGMRTKVEAEQRVFPITDRAQSVWEVLVSYMREGKVTVALRTAVAGFEQAGGRIAGIILAPGAQLEKSNHRDTGTRTASDDAMHRVGKDAADSASKSKILAHAISGSPKIIMPRLVTAGAYILATGGKSRPETGSTGDGFAWLTRLGHTVSESDAALVPVKIKEPWVKSLAGVSLRDAKLSIFQNGALQTSSKGKLLFTHFGISGPLVLNSSRSIGELLKYGPVTLSLDLLPTRDAGAVDREIQSVFEVNKNKKLKNCLGSFVSPALAPVLIVLAGIDPQKPIHTITRAERLKLVSVFKALPLTVSGLMDDKAVVTSGGVQLEEVDFKTMQSRLYPNLYIIGDLLNIDRPSGGYSLQLCWTTGFVAGTHAASLTGTSHAR